MTANLHVVPLNSGNLADIPASLRKLADEIECGEHGAVTHFSWVLDADFEPVKVGLIGRAESPDAVCIGLFEIAKHRLIEAMGK